MKKKYLVELFIALLILVTIIAKLTKVPGAGSALTIILIGTSIFYLTAGFSFFYEKNAEKHTKAFSILMIVILFLSNWFVLFKFQLWTFSFNLSLILAISLLAASLFVLLKWYKMRLIYFRDMLYRSVFYCIIVLCCVLIPSSKLIDIYYKGESEEYIELMKQLYENPRNESIIKQIENYDSLKQKR